MQALNAVDLKSKASEVRRQILKTTYTAGCGHTGGSLSEADLLTALFFKVMNIDPDDPRMAERDRFILSKGHATPGYYSVLALRGFFDTDELMRFDQMGSILQGHPDMHKTPGVDISSGSLGQGLSLGLGMRIAGQALGLDFRVFVLLGDGESQEGQVWEAALYGGAHMTPGLVAITDLNSIQLSGTVDQTLSLGQLRSKWEAFGWQVLECDGNNMDEVVPALEQAVTLSARGPVMVLAKTVKGKGVSFMENDCLWHGKAPDDNEYKLAMEELSGAEA